MPNKNGIDTMKELVDIKPGLKIIFLSADASVRQDALEFGAIGFLEKPIDFSELIALLH